MLDFKMGGGYERVTFITAARCILRAFMHGYGCHILYEC